jgi:hypothetical protein
LSRLEREKRLVEDHLKDLEGIIVALHKISLPSMLSIAEGNAEIRVVDKSLRLRSQQLLKRGRWAPAPYVPMP